MSQIAHSPNSGIGNVETYSLSSKSLFASEELRIDAGHYNPEFLAAIDVLNQSGMRLERLGDIVYSVHLPTRFKRVYVEKEKGIPFLQGSHVIQFLPDDMKYLSSKSHRNLDEIVIRAGWLLITRSGTVGRISICPSHWDGFVASEHIIRVIPDEKKCPSGYLSAFLASPIGQAQLTANIYGAVVDELTEEQVQGVLVPLPKTPKDKALVSSLDATMQESVAKRSEAVAAAAASVRMLNERLS